MSQPLAGKVAIVTGAARGIGKGIALALAQSGAHIVLHYNTSEQYVDAACREIEAHGVRVTTIQADLQELSAAHEIVSAAIEVHGTVDILVNNAGVFSSKPALEISPKDWQRVHMINLQSPFLLCQAAARVMLAQQGGVIA